MLKLKKLIAPGLAVALLGCVGAVVAAPLPDVASAKNQATDHLNLMQFRLKMFHQEARSSMLASLDLDLFSDYFSLPESLRNHYDELGAIKLSPAQAAIRQRIEKWALTLHDRFPIGETCLIDRHGQEHMRVVGGKVELPIHFSDEEHGAPFFQPSFGVGKGEVHISLPYMSADSYRWVISFTSPVVREDGAKPGFYHFEVPLSIHQQIVSTVDYKFQTRGEPTPDFDEEGRTFILDRSSGLLIADSRQQIDYELRAERHPEKNDQLPDYLPPEKIEEYLPGVNSISRATAFSAAVQQMMKGGSGELVFDLPDRTYVMIFAPVAGRDWSIAHLDPVGGPGFWVGR